MSNIWLPFDKKANTSIYICRRDIFVKCQHLCKMLSVNVLQFLHDQFLCKPGVWKAVNMCIVSVRVVKRKKTL